MVKIEIKTRYVRKRPARGDRRIKIKRGVIYLTGAWVGRKVKVVNFSTYLGIVKRLRLAETRLRKINKISK